MRIRAIQAAAVRIPRDMSAAQGTAGSPAALEGAAGQRRYRRARHYGTVYSSDLETTLVRVESDTGLVGWGEAQAPVVPEAAAAIVNVLLGPMLVGEDARDLEAVWDAMYDAMRVRGHGGGFYLDAMAGVDLALWDLRGKANGRPVSALIAPVRREAVPLYVSGLPGATPAEKVKAAQGFAASGARAFKVFLDATMGELLEIVDALRSGLDDSVVIHVDALWRLTRQEAPAFADALAARRVGWLEAPLPPEDLEGHRQLALRSPVPLAIGECYRTPYEVRPWLEAGAVGVLQPDLGRTGITGALRLAELAQGFQVPLAPHVSVGLGPQIAAAVHFATACPSVRVLECNPLVYEAANRFSTRPFAFDVSRVSVPDVPGLGVELDVDKLAQFGLAALQMESLA